MSGEQLAMGRMDLGTLHVTTPFFSGAWIEFESRHLGS